MLHRVFLAFVLVAPAVCAAAPDTFVFPNEPAAPTPPAPKPNPNAVPLLTPDVLYIVSSKADAVVRPHPAGLVKVTKEAGPIKIRGKFIDGTKIETRTFPGPFVFILEATGTGRCEIDFIPLGLKSEDEIVAKVIDVDTGTAPQPPPVPVPVPTPDDPLLKVLQIAYDGEPDKVVVGDQTFPKGNDKASAAAVFRALSTAATDPAIKTGDDFFALTHNSLESRIPNRLKKVRAAVGAELNKILPNGNNAGKLALTDQQKKDASALYVRVAGLLDKVK